MCPECQDMRFVIVLSRNPESGAWDNPIVVRCSVCPATPDDDDPDDTDLYVEPVQ